MLLFTTLLRPVRFPEGILWAQPAAVTGPDDSVVCSRGDGKYAAVSPNPSFGRSTAFDNLRDSERLVCTELIERLHVHCGVRRDAHGLFGSSALGCRIANSDFDWIIYDLEAINSVSTHVDESPEFVRGYSFTWEY